MTGEQLLLGGATGPDATAAKAVSVYAARLALPRSGSKRLEVLTAIAKAGEGGVTDDEMCDWYGWQLPALRPRRKELVDSGWVQDSGQHRPGPRGAPSIAWRLTQRGHNVTSGRHWKCVA